MGRFRISRPKERRDETSDDNEKERTGLHELWPGRADNAAKIETKLDIVAVHGLNGDLYKTWTEGNRLWLQDFLPQSIPEARIFTFGYNANIAFSKSISKIDDYARTLLERLKARRKDFPDARRPIIFICHSLGGVVFKKAMILARERSDRYESLSRDVCGVMFMGTPHRGSDVAFWSKFFRSFANTLTLGNIRTSLLKDLEPKSETLWNISSAFIQRGKSLKKIFSFYEQHTIGGVLIVEPQSAILQLSNEVAIPLEADHRSMCRFATASSEKFLTVLDALRELVEDSLEVDQSYSTSDRSAFIGSLNAIRPGDILFRITTPYEGTCSWFSHSSVYRNWRAGLESKVLWLWGAAGIGKTVMMKHIIRNFQNHTTTRIRDNQEVSAFFFCDDKDWLRRSHSIVAMSLLDQILAQNLELIRYIDVRDIRDYVKSGSPPKADLPHDLADILWRAIMLILQRSHNTTFWFYIDALDELEPSSRRTVLDQFSSMLDKDFANRLRVVFSDRVGPHVRSFALPALVHELGEVDAESDVKHYLHNEGSRFGSSKGLSSIDQQSIETTLLDVASGNFLHATLAWANFHKGVSFWSARVIENRLAMVRKISRDTASYYCVLLAKIPEDVVAISRRAFAWTIGARRPLTIKELQHAIALDSTQINSRDFDREKVLSFELEFEENFAYLLRCDYDGSVHLSHQTIKELLMSQPGSFSVDNELVLKHFRVNDESLNLEIAGGCLTLLNFNDFARAGSRQSIEELVDEVQLDVQELRLRELEGNYSRGETRPGKGLEKIRKKVQDRLPSEKFALIFYAICYWNVHFADCASHESTIRLVERFLKNWQALPFYRIAVLLDYFPVPESKNHNERKPPIHFLLQLGDYPEVIDKLIEHGDSPNITDSDMWTPLMYAVANERPKSVQCLLSRSSTQLTRNPILDYGPVHLACREYADVGILTMIINDPRADINAKNKKGSAPVHLLLQNASHKSLCKKLLERRDLDISSKNEFLESYLDQCFFRGLGEDLVITILSRPEVGFTALKEKPRGLSTASAGFRRDTSYVSMANQWGWHELEILILQHDPAQALQASSGGMSLLESYAFYGTWWRLQDLLNYLPADTYQKYAPRNSLLLHLCARQDWEPLATLLQEKFKLSAIETDEHNRTILFYACEFQWSSIVKLCEGKSWEQINQQSRDGKTALIVAVENKNEVAVEALLEAGADILIQDNRGRTAVHAAAEHGNRFILKLLLQKPFREHGRDFQKRALLHYMVMWESKENVLRYIKKFKPVINIFDHRRRTPLIYAVTHRNTLAGEALLESNADPGLKDASGSTAMHYALSEGLVDFSKLLLEYDVSISELDGYGRSALHLALRSKNFEMIEFVINLIIEQQERRAADPRTAKSEFDLSYMVHHTDIFGQTAIHRACFLENKIESNLADFDEKEDLNMVGQCISELRSLGADINQRDRNRVAPLHVAVKNNNRAAVHALLGFPEIMVNACDNLGCTALDWSVAQDEIRITASLRRHEARHSQDFRRKLNMPPPEAKIDAVYDPNLWSIANLPPEERERYWEEQRRERQKEIALRNKRYREEKDRTRD